jgi:hypothetical protein
MTRGSRDKARAPNYKPSITHYYYLSSINCKSFAWRQLPEGKTAGTLTDQGKEQDPHPENEAVKKRYGFRSCKKARVP